MITSAANPRIKYIRRLQNDRRFREREQAYIIEGTRWLAELGQSGLRPQLILYTESWSETPEHQELLQQIGGPTLSVSDAVMSAVSETQTPAGLLAVVSMTPRPLPEQPTLVLILDQVGDPGNLGTMLRTAAAAGVEGVLLAPGTVDVYNPKVVRSSMGALLRLPVHRLTWPEIEHVCRNLQVWLAAADGRLPYTEADWRRPAALIIGSEASGAGAEAARLATGQVSIPMVATTESLNAAMAAGIILFEAVRQRSQGDQS